jgi:hypothetical protein
MASKSKRARTAPQRNLAKTFLYWAITIFIIKLIIILNIPASNFDILANPYKIEGAWLGADGENYLTGYEFLKRDGIFSKESILSYWPAGYPLILLALSLISKSWLLTILSIFQSLIFSFTIYIFASQLARTKLKKYSYLVFLLIILNPTLSLSSIAVGYESLAAAGFLLASSLIIKDCIDRDNNKFLRYLLINSAIFGFLAFMQPRLIIAGILTISLWIIVRKGIKSGSPLLIISLTVTLFFPASLMYRNHQANGFNTISTNLGVTMNIGAGDKATGGYMTKDYGVPCNLNGNAAEQDEQLTKCVINWYFNNPIKALNLFYNKTINFFSPWYGPKAGGTMARNPWLKISPLADIGTTPDGANLVYGGIGKLVSWLWLLGGLS